MSDELELKDWLDMFLEELQVQDIQELNDLMNEAMENLDYTRICEAYKKTNKTNINFIQRLYQFYLSDREEMKQDFSPVSLAKLCSLWTDGDIILDLCGGVGTLTYEHHKHHHAEYIIIEKDETVIPYLLFLCLYYGINATINVGDALTNQYENTYIVKDGFITRNVQTTLTPIVPSGVISNPPFNLRSKNNLLIGNQEFKSLLNYAFVQAGIQNTTKNAKLAYILPNGVLSSTLEEQYRKQLVDKGILRAVITCPTSMFESTSIPVCVLLLDKKKHDKITFINMKEEYDVEIRYQKGEGDASHRNRNYKKNVSVWNDKHYEKILSAINDEKAIPGECKTVTINDVVEQDYVITPGRYIGWKPEEDTSRSYEDILQDLNRIRTEKNKLKLTVNKVWAKELGLDDIIKDHIAGKKLTDETNSFLKFMDLPLLEVEDWIASSNSKVLKWENKNKEELSVILLNVIPMWKQHINYLNLEENRLLSELRDKLLPELMSGSIDVSDFDVS